jgi:isoleucyl-tRNA synthetase
LVSGTKFEADFTGHTQRTIMTEKYPLNLPQTEFPMKANSATREVETQKFWDDNKIYEKSLEKRKTANKFVLHDGPPYLSSAKIHIGTALNKILKDIVTKYKAQKGFYAPYVPGYDSHGLPIETAVLKEVKGGRAALTPVELRRRCRDFALGRKPTSDDWASGVIGRTRTSPWTKNSRLLKFAFSARWRQPVTSTRV